MKNVTLEGFKKANKQAREKIAKKNGFADASIFLMYLKGENIINSPLPVFPLKKSRRKKIQPVSEGIIPTIHNVHILDASGSMSGSKITNAIAGINGEIAELHKDRGVNYTQTIVDFSGSGDIKTKLYKVPIGDVKYYYTESRGMTALNEAVGTVLERLLKDTNKGEKTLVKIFSDGFENNSRGKYRNPSEVAKLITECEANGFTITFVGTQIDVNNITHLFSIDASNTLVHDNTGEGVARSYKMSAASTLSFTSNVKAGKSVTKGFYKKVGKL